MVYHLSMFYLVRNEASYQSFEGYFYGLVQLVCGSSDRVVFAFLEDHETFSSSC